MPTVIKSSYKPTTWSEVIEAFDKFTGSGKVAGPGLGELLSPVTLASTFLRFLDPMGIGGFTPGMVISPAPWRSASKLGAIKNTLSKRMDAMRRVDQSIQKEFPAMGRQIENLPAYADYTTPGVWSSKGDLFKGSLFGGTPRLQDLKPGDRTEMLKHFSPETFSQLKFPFLRVAGEPASNITRHELGHWLVDKYPKLQELNVGIWRDLPKEVSSDMQTLMMLGGGKSPTGEIIPGLSELLYTKSPQSIISMDLSTAPQIEEYKSILQEIMRNPEVNVKDLMQNILKRIGTLR